MLRRLARPLAILSVLAAAAPSYAQTADASLAAAEAFRERKFEVAVGLLTELIGSGGLRGDALSDAYWNRGISYAALGDKAMAFEDFQRFATMTPDSADGQTKLIELGVELKRYDAAARAFKSLTELSPARARDRRVDVLITARSYQLQGEWEEAGALLERYARIDDEDPGINVSRARTAAARGRSADAIDLIRRSAGQHNLVLVRADNAFAALWDDPAFATAADITALYERDLIQAEQGPSDRLFTVVLRMSALWRLGRFDQAIRLGQQVLSSDLSSYPDRDYREAQVHEQLARSLVMKGDLAAAEEAFRAGVAQLSTTSETVVTLLMSGGQFLAATADKYKDALEFADRADTFARLIYGSGIGDSVRALAYWGLKEQRNLDRILTQVEENLSTSQSIAVDLYLLIGRPDAAARLVASQLADPARVDTVLVSLQRYVKNRPANGAIEKVIEEGWRGLRAHPLVLGALSRVGRITDVPAANRF
jgi:tetratricopeptide (TPR) repeat protein